MAQIKGIRIEDYSEEVLKELDSRVMLALKAIGVEAMNYAVKDCPVDTSRLKNSLAWATKNEHGGGDAPKGSPEDYKVYIGTNVKYAVYVEYGDYSHKVGKKHFLRDAAANHVEHYMELLRSALDGYV